MPEGEGCCGALVHHMGREEQALASARQNVDAWMREIENGGLDAIVITASGCGTTIKDYGFMLRLDPAYAEKAAKNLGAGKGRHRISGHARPAGTGAKARPRRSPIIPPVPCSTARRSPASRRNCWPKAGFIVREPREGHLCCGSAGTYNIMQPEISATLRDRKVKNIEATGADIVATGNIGCITQIAVGAGMPIVHTVELLDWAYGGPRPKGI